MAWVDQFTWKQRYEGVMALLGEWDEDCGKLQAQLAERDAEIERLRAALGRYSLHRWPGCKWPYDTSKPCSCGLEEALRRGEGET